MVAIDAKGRTILKEEDAEMVAMFLAGIRGHIVTGEGVTVDDWTHTRQVLAAIAKAGWAIVPQGQLDGWKKVLFERDIPVSGAYMETERPDIPSVLGFKREPEKKE